ncbi:phytoene desaturase family protein [Candidatus Margulisiibacteriota bacterium]
MFKGISQNQLKPKYDIVVIGSGIGGLTCANYLAKAGLSVLVVERHFQPGGYCTSFKRKGYTFSVCNNLIPACGSKEFIGYNLKMLDAQVEFVALESLTLNYQDFNLRLMLNEDNFKQILSEKFPEESKNIARFIKDIGRIYRHFIKFKTGDQLINQTAATTYIDFLNGYFKNQQLKDVLSFIFIDVGDYPNAASALPMSIVLFNFINGLYSVIGGVQNFSDRLCESLMNKGGQVLLSKEVKEIIIDNNQVRGVKLSNDSIIEASTVVSNADAVQTFTKLINKNSPLLEQYINKLKKNNVCLPGYQLFLGVNRDDFDDGYYFYDKNDIKKMFLLLSGTKVDKTLAPPGKGTLALTMPTPEVDYDRITDWKNCKEQLDEKAFALLEKYYPKIRNAVEVKESATPGSYYRYTLNHNGSVFGWAHTPDQVWMSRLDNKTPISGLFLVGHWTRPGGGIRPVFSSGMIVSKMVLEGFKKDV